MKRERLTYAQETWLIMAAAGGVSASTRHVSLNALLRRGLVEPRHCRSSLDNRQWVATYAGRQWLRTRDSAPGDRSRWAAQWSEATRG